MSTTDELVPVLKKLRLSRVLETLTLRLRQTAEDNLDPTEFLFRLLHDEVERREAKQLHLRMGRAGFEHGRTLEDFDFTFNPLLPKARLIDLATCCFVERHDNILLVGPAGVGKSHLGQPRQLRSDELLRSVWPPPCTLDVGVPITLEQGVPVQLGSGVRVVADHRISLAAPDAIS